MTTTGWQPPHTAVRVDDLDFNPTEIRVLAHSSDPTPPRSKTTTGRTSANYFPFYFMRPDGTVIRQMLKASG